MKVKSIGIDVSKDKFDICLLLENEKTKHLQFSNNQSDVPRLIKILKSYQSVEDTPIVIEATGGYHYAITFSLQEKDFHKVFVINPLITKKYLNSSVRKCKTDKADAVLLAKIGLIEKLDRFRETKDEILRKKKVRLLKFINIQLTRVSNKIKMAESSTADQFEINFLKDMKKDLNKQKKKIEKAILTSIDLDFEKIRGVSELSFKAIAIELGNIKRFRNHKQVVAFAGLDPSVKESGTSVNGRSKLSKRGSKTLRDFLFKSAWGLMMHNEEYRKYYNKKKNEEKKHYYTCLTAMARKLLCEIFAKLKNHPYYAHSS